MKYVDPKCRIQSVLASADTCITHTPIKMWQYFYCHGKSPHAHFSALWLIFIAISEVSPILELHTTVIQNVLLCLVSLDSVYFWGLSMLLRNGLFLCIVRHILLYEYHNLLIHSLGLFASFSCCACSCASLFVNICPISLG